VNYANTKNCWKAFYCLRRYHRN